jgi:hypothetical protein
MKEGTRQNSKYFEKILGSILEFLLLGGVDHATIQSQVTKYLERKRSSAAASTLQDSTSSVSETDAVAAAVLHKWFRDARLLDSRARPKPLSLYGPAPSIESLVRAEQPQGSAKGVVRTMRALGLVEDVSRGKYIPKSRVATVSSLHPIVIEHVAKSIARYLGTINQNTSAQSSKAKLIERFASVRDLPEKDLQAFCEFSQNHGTAFLSGVDDWLEARRPKSRSAGKSSGLTAGIHVFAYVEKKSAATGSAKQSRRPARPA